MFGGRCSLCGGKLSRGVCVECGLDQKEQKRRSKAGYSSTVSSDMEYSSTINTDIEHSSQPRQNVTTTTYHTTAENKKKKTSILKWVILTFIGFNVLGVVLSGIGGIVGYMTNTIIQENGPDSMEQVVYTQEEIEENSKYFLLPFKIKELTSEYTEHQVSIPTSGEAFDVLLDSGFYEVGVDLPTGIYNVEGALDSAIEIINEKYEKSCYDYVMEEQITDSGKSFPVEIYLMEGTILYISRGEFQFTSEVADVSSMVIPEESEAVDSYYVTETEEIGINIPEGIYNISIPNNHRSSIELFLEDRVEDYEYLGINLNTYEEGYEFEAAQEVVRNVPLWKGLTLELEQDDFIILTPVERNTENMSNKFEEFMK